MFLCLHKKSMMIKLYSCAKHGMQMICLACRACTTSAPLLQVLKWVEVGWTRLAILWQQELILNSTCRLSALSQLARKQAYHFCSGVCLYLPLVPLLYLLPISCFLFCPTEAGVWIRPYKGLDHASLCNSLSGAFFSANVLESLWLLLLSVLLRLRAEVMGWC